MHTQTLIRQLVLVGVSAVPLAASARPEMNYGLSFNGDLWGNSFSSSFDFDEDGLSGMNMNLSGPLLRAQAGDVSASWDQLGLAGRSFRASRRDSPSARSICLCSAELLSCSRIIWRGGSAICCSGALAGCSPIYGVRASVPLRSKFELSASRLVAPNAPAEQGKGISTLALSYQHSAQQNLTLELAAADGATAGKFRAPEKATD
jgi:hypothetical protein